MMLLLYVRRIGQAMRWTAMLCAVVLIGCAVEEPAQEEPTVEVTPTEAPGPSQDEEESELPGDYGEIIAAETDCRQLQEIFDTAETAAEGMRDRDDIEMAEWFVAVMNRADERMAEVGCYD